MGSPSANRIRILSSLCPLRSLLTCPKIGRVDSSRAKGSAAGGVKVFKTCPWMDTSRVERLGNGSAFNPFGALASWHAHVCRYRLATVHGNAAVCRKVHLVMLQRRTCWTLGDLAIAIEGRPVTRT